MLVLMSHDLFLIWFFATESDKVLKVRLFGGDEGYKSKCSC